MKRHKHDIATYCKRYFGIAFGEIVDEIQIRIKRMERSDGNTLVSET